MYISKSLPWLKSHCSRLTASLLPAAMHVPAPTRPLHMARCALCPNYPRVSIADMAMVVWIRCPNARVEFYSHVCRSCFKLEWREFARDYTDFVAARNYACTAAACEVCADNIILQIKRRDLWILDDTEVFMWKLPRSRP